MKENDRNMNERYVILNVLHYNMNCKLNLLEMIDQAEYFPHTLQWKIKMFVTHYWFMDISLSCWCLAFDASTFYFLSVTGILNDGKNLS